VLLYERLRAGDPGPDKPSGELGPDFWSDLRRATVVRVDNVADHFFADNSQEDWNPAKDFPNVAPPWPVAFFEYRVPSVINSGGYVRRAPSAGLQIGLLLRSDLFDPTRSTGFQSGQIDQVQTEFIETSNAHWICHAISFMATREKVVLGTLIQFMITADGQMLARDGRPLIAVTDMNDRHTTNDLFDDTYMGRVEGDFPGVMAELERQRNLGHAPPSQDAMAATAGCARVDHSVKLGA
jgi:hypothetical protein